MSSSTEVPNAWPLRNISDEEVAVFLRISPQEARKRRPGLARQLADPAWVAQTLDAAPAATLAALHLMIEAGGMRSEATLVHLARERFGMSQADLEAALREAIRWLLAVPLRTARGELMLAAVEPAAALIAPLLAGLDLLALAATDFAVTESSSRNPRLFIAVCAAARHCEIKLTAAGQIHRGSIKRLAKQVGVDETSLAVMLGTGLDVGVLRADDDSVRLDLAMLCEAAQGRYPRYAPLGVLAAQLGDAAVAVDAAVGLIQRSRAAEHTGLFGEALGHVPGLVTGTVNGVAACMWRAPGGTAAGHVTPSFEVFLPPESRLLDVAHVGDCCEWERLDRAFVARITKPSIARAVAAGARAEQILERLAAANRHPIPQNVEAAIRDWAGSLVSATVATGHVIVVDPGAAPRVAAALAKLAARELAPGVFLVEQDTRFRDVTLALDRAGIRRREASAHADSARAAPDAAADSSTAEIAILSPEASRLRARVAAWRRGEAFEGVRDDFLEKQRAAQRAAQVVEPDPAPLARLERWVATHAPDLARDVSKYASVVSLTKLLSRSELEAILDDCKNVGELLSGITRAAVRRAQPRSPATSRRPGTRVSPRPRSSLMPRRSPALLWQHEDRRTRLESAAQRADALALQLASGIRYVEIDRVIRRGTIWMILGENLVDGNPIAVPLDDIQAVAALPDDFEIESIAPDDGDEDDDDLDDDDLDDDDLDDEPAGRKPWQPAPGQAAPAGHVRCPCGSGLRYRSCCRAVATA